MHIDQRYNSISSFLNNRFGRKVYKVSIQAGLTCPNRDGSKGTGGCIYCNPESNLPFVSRGKDIPEQLREGIEYVKGRHRAGMFIPYFQHYSNTYAPSGVLRKMFFEAIGHRDVVGLAVSTRPDCLDNGVLDVLSEVSREVLLWLELGLQSAHDHTLKLINRGHTAAEFADAVRRANERGIMTCAHIILGLPGETPSDTMDTIAFLRGLRTGGVKIHNLHVLKDTPLAGMHERGELSCLSLEGYASLVVDCLERLPKDVLIHRFNSHSPRRLTIAPLWSVNKLGTMNAVHDELERRDSWQGKLL
jgi:radical SAM protein (TIGR01212 family)